MSLVFFAVYLDELLVLFVATGVAGALAYTDDIVLLGPCASVLRALLSTCETFTCRSGFCFNPLKTQLIRFHLFDNGSVSDDLVQLYGSLMQFYICVISDISDDILLKTRY